MTNERLKERIVAIFREWWPDQAGLIFKFVREAESAARAGERERCAQTVEDHTESGILCNGIRASDVDAGHDPGRCCCTMRRWIARAIRESKP